MEVWLGLIAEVALGDSPLRVAHVSSSVISEGYGLWVEVSSNALWIILDGLGIGVQFLADDNSPEFWLMKSINGDDSSIEMFSYSQLSVRVSVWERGPHVVDVGGMGAAEIIVTSSGGLPAELDIADGVFIGPASGYRYMGDVVRWGVVGFVGPRFSDTFHGSTLGVEALLRVASPGGGFGFFSKARAQVFFNTRADAAAEAVTVPVLITEMGVMYRW
jgi:hypothetical protein